MRRSRFIILRIEDEVLARIAGRKDCFIDVNTSGEDEEMASNASHDNIFSTQCILAMLSRI